MTVRRPPAWLNRLLVHVVDDSDRESLPGDFSEQYRNLLADRGRCRADLWFTAQVIPLVVAAVILQWRQSMDLFIHQVKTAWRVFRRDTIYSLINWVGLALGLAVTLLILLWVGDERAYDRFHVGIDRLYRVPVQIWKGGQASITYENSPAPLAAHLVEAFPEIETAARLSVFPSEFLVEAGTRRFDEKGIYLVDPTFLDLFTFPLLEGDKTTALNRPDGAVITQSLARKYFGDANPMGQTLRLNQEDTFVITGVAADCPSHSTIQFQMLLPFDFCLKLGRNLENWAQNYYYTTVRLQPGADVAVLQEKLDAHFQARQAGRNTQTLYRLFPMAHRHLYHIDGTPGRLSHVRVLTWVAALICLIAAVNFVNLATARASRREREVGVRKTLGAARRLLFRQFMGESLLMAAMSLLLGLALAALLMPWVNGVAGKSLWEAVPLTPWLFPLILGIPLLLGLLGGAYPAWLMARMDMRRSLLSQSRGGTGRQGLRQILVVVQFALTGGLLIATWVMTAQLGFMQNKALGLQHDALVYVPIHASMQHSFRQIRALALTHPAVTAATASSSLPTAYNISSGGFDWEGRDPEQFHSFILASADYDFVTTFGMTLTAGRDYSLENPADSSLAMLINESAAQVLGFEDPIGKTITFGGGRFGGPFTIIGVVKDFHFTSLETPIQPLLLPFFEQWHSHLFFRIQPQRLQEALAHIRQSYEAVEKRHPFELRFLDEDYKVLYQDYLRLKRLLGAFSTLALVVACMGLVGLAAYAAQRRMKEIGIRKTLGASMPRLAVTLLSSLLKGVFLAQLIAGPVALWLMGRWLAGFSYRITPSWTLALWAALLGLGVAIIAVGPFMLRATLVNPVQILRSE